MNYFKNIAFVILLGLSACLVDERNVAMDPYAESTFKGTLNAINSGNISGKVTLTINNGAYHCNTSLPFGRGAGLLSVDDKTINFMDTLFFPVPALFGPSYIPSGLHNYRFNGQKLILWKSLNVGEIEYELEKEN